MPPLTLKAASMFLVLLLCGTVQAAGDITVMALFKGKAVLRIDGVQHMLSAGETSPEGVKLISATSREAVLEVDGRQATYALGGHIGSTFTPPAARTETRVYVDNSGMFTTVGSINGRPVSFLVDTGATTIAMNANEARRLGINYLYQGTQGAVTTASGVTRAYNIRLDRVQVGDITLRNVDAVVIEGDYPVTVLLGMSFLGQLEVSNDGRVMVLKKKF